MPASSYSLQLTVIPTDGGESFYTLLVSVPAESAEVAKERAEFFFQGLHEMGGTVRVEAA